MKITTSEVLKLFVNNISQFVFWKDRNSVYQGCNRNFANYAGLTDPEQVFGMTDYEMPWSKEEADFFVKIDQEVMAQGKAQLNFEEPQTLSDGSTRWISTSKVPIYDDEKAKVIGILGWYIDITPYKAMQIQMDQKDQTLLSYSKRLEQSRNELEQSNSDLELFTYAVSHDLKSPIRKIVGFSELIFKQHGQELDQAVAEKLQVVLDAGKSMNSLVQNILSYAQTGLEELDLEVVNIQQLIKEKLKDLDASLFTKDTKVDISLTDILISCYPELLGMAIYNIISNGLKYNESELPTVTCSLEDLPSKIIFCFSDNGIGISPEYRDRIFQPFKRLDSSKFAGTGLGLSICKRIIDLHKGDIWIEDNIHGGSTFKFSISKDI